MPGAISAVCVGSVVRYRRPVFTLPLSRRSVGNGARTSNNAQLRGGNARREPGGMRKSRVNDQRISLLYLYLLRVLIMTDELTGLPTFG